MKRFAEKNSPALLALCVILSCLPATAFAVSVEQIETRAIASKTSIYDTTAKRLQKSVFWRRFGSAFCGFLL